MSVSRAAVVVGVIVVARVSYMSHAFVTAAFSFILSLFARFMPAEYSQSVSQQSGMLHIIFDICFSHTITCQYICSLGSIASFCYCNHVFVVVARFLLIFNVF